MAYPKHIYKIIGEILLSIPIIFLAVLGIGELSGGIISGIQHFFQLLPLILLAIISWFYPKIGGTIITLITVLMGIIYFISFSEFPIYARLINTALLFGFPIAAGIVFLFSSKNEKRISNF